MTLRFKPALRARLDAEADHTGMPLSAIILTAVDSYLCRQERERSRPQQPPRPRPAQAPAAGRSQQQHQRPAHSAAPIKLQQLTAPKPGVNEPCSCGSGIKYKKCCRPKDVAAGLVR